MTIRSLLLLAVMTAFLSGATSNCSEYRKQLTGPSALSYWAWKRAQELGRPGVRTQEDTIRVEQELLNKVNRYIDAHPELPKDKKDQLRKFTVHVGMTKEEIRLLLGEPFEILKTPETLQGMAKDEWKDTEEAWIYRSYAGEKYYYPYVLYFRADTITHIIRIIPPIWWL